MKYLVENKAKIDPKNIFGSTPLHLSVERGHFEIAICLIEHGANVEARDEFGRTSLHLVANSPFDGKIEMFEYLISLSLPILV